MVTVVLLIVSDWLNMKLMAAATSVQLHSHSKQVRSVASVSTRARVGHFMYDLWTLKTKLGCYVSD